MVLLRNKKHAVKITPILLVIYRRDNGLTGHRAVVLKQKHYMQNRMECPRSVLDTADYVEYHTTTAAVIYNQRSRARLGKNHQHINTEVVSYPYWRNLQYAAQLACHFECHMVESESKNHPDMQ